MKTNYVLLAAHGSSWNPSRLFPAVIANMLLKEIKGTQNHCILTRESTCHHALFGKNDYRESVFTGLQFLQDSTACGKILATASSLAGKTQSWKVTQTFTC